MYILFYAFIANPKTSTHVDIMYINCSHCIPKWQKLLQNNLMHIHLYKLSVEFRQKGRELTTTSLHSITMANLANKDSHGRDQMKKNNQTHIHSFILTIYVHIRKETHVC